jgi:multiple sugar transport system permease protein
MLAVLLNQDVRGLSIYRTIFYLPSVVSGVAVAMLWLWVFNPELGVVNSLLGIVGIEGPKWFASSKWALTTFIITSLWGIGGGMVIYLAGLQGVPTSLYEAAELDGATAWHRFWHITIPMTSPVIFFNLIMGIIGSFQVFTGGYVITNGGPANATLFYVLYLYRNAFQYFKMGYASALAWILFIVILVLTLLMFRLVGGLVYYEGSPRKG